MIPVEVGVDVAALSVVKGVVRLLTPRKYRKIYAEHLVSSMRDEFGAGTSAVPEKKKAVIKKNEARFVVLEPKPEYVIDRLNNGLYR